MTGRSTAEEDLLDPMKASPVVAAWVQRWVSADSVFESRIHPADEMYRFGLESLRGVQECAAILYYLKGYQIATTLRQAVASERPGGLSGIPSLLDFASGFGRSTRFLALQLPPSRVWVSEIQPGAGDFQRDLFGVHTVAATGEPDAFRPERTFPCILASSFFSHAPPRKFQDWLKSLFACLDPEGLLLFSVHGSALAPAGTDWSEGILFLPESESRVLAAQEYGTAYVTEGYVRGAVRAASGGRWGLEYYPFGFCGQQDLCIAVPAGREAPRIDIFPRGDLVGVNKKSGKLRLTGWASSQAVSDRTLTVNLYVGNALRDSGPATEPDAGNLSRASWELTTDLSTVAPDDAVAVTAVTSLGLENILAMGTLKSAGLA